jgi:hypothetical protein
VDLNQNFQTRKAASTANICLCTTEHIRNRLLAFNSKTFKINHGYNVSESAIKPVILPGQSSIKAMYAGNLAMPYIDWELIHVLVNENPGVDFIFVGPDRDDRVDGAKREVRKSENTFFIGRVKSNDLLSYYEAADILMVAYQERYHADQANPHKMMEYLGSGKMIVATFTAEFADLSNRNLLMMSRQNTDHSKIFSETLNDLIAWNADEKQQLRRAWALDNSYDKQLDRIENLLNAELH